MLSSRPDRMPEFYLPPVDRLLKLGAEPARRRTWPDYRNLGLEDHHVPALIRMATDPALHAAEEWSAAGWAPIHAWRALAQLRAPAAAEPLLALLEREMDSTWVFEELPVVLGMIGPAALPGATLLLFDEGKDEDLRFAACGVILNVAHEYPERRDEAAGVLAQQLADWRDQSPQMNAILVSYLVELNDTAAAPVMEEAFAAGRVDVTITGPWEDVQVDLGLLPEPEAGRTMDHGFPPADGLPRPSASKPGKSKAQRKAEKEARKRNRKKK
jgi:HEAT repeat protein